MKNLVILIILVGLGYFAYNAFNTSDTVTQSGTTSQLAQQEGLEDIAGELPRGQQGALVDFNNQIQGAIADAKDAVEKTQDRVNGAIEEGITDFAETNVDVVVEEDPSVVSGSYVDYDNVTLASLDGNIVLDFYASWCPSCRKLEKDIEASLGDIPSNLTIVKVNYDTETDLKSQYGVTRQHTLVQVDNQGNLIKKWSGGNTLESIVAEVE